MGGLWLSVKQPIVVSRTTEDEYDLVPRYGFIGHPASTAGLFIVTVVRHLEWKGPPKHITVNANVYCKETHNDRTTIINMA